MTSEIIVTARKLAWGQKVTPAFRDRMHLMASNLTTLQGVPFDSDSAMGCIAWESGETFSPNVRNGAGSGATGLIQFMPTTAAGLGTTTALLAAMTAVQQLDFVEKYFANAIKAHGALASIEDMYMSILWPAAIGKASSYVLFNSATQAIAYRQNAGLDADHNGQVTKYEAAARPRAELLKGLKLLA